MAKRLDSQTVDKVFATQNLKPLEPYLGKSPKRKCVCLTCGHESLVSYARVRDGGKCAYCSGKRVNLGDVEALLDEIRPQPV